MAGRVRFPILDAHEMKDDGGPDRITTMIVAATDVPQAEDPAPPQLFRCAASSWKIASFRFISSFGSST
jgi:hypothetical protein